MPSSTLISTVVGYDRALGHDELRNLTGRIVNGLMLDQPITEQDLADITYENQIRLNRLPELPVVKMGRAEHVEQFFASGSLQLGTFKYFGKFAHPEIGDKSEGYIVAVAQGPRSTLLAELGGGFNNYVFCCYLGEEGRDFSQASFGYDAGFEIVDVLGFANAIGRALKATRNSFGACVYRRHKVLVAVRPARIVFNTMSAELLDIVSESKYFIKPDHLSHQSEFRFLWEVPSDVEDAIVLRCPEAVAFCRRLRAA